MTEYLLVGLAICLVVLLALMQVVIAYLKDINQERDAADNQKDKERNEDHE